MFMVIESRTGDAAVGAPAQPDDWLVRLAAQTSEAVAESRGGDVIRLHRERAATEIVLGFRPGIDRIVVPTDAGPHARLLTTERDGNAVIVDGQRRRIVILGVRLDELVPGDIEMALA